MTRMCTTFRPDIIAPCSAASDYRRSCLLPLKKRVSPRFMTVFFRHPEER
jgi:hypothetical protein